MERKMPGSAWIRIEDHLELQAEQRSPDWFRLRRRVTASHVAGLLGLSPFSSQRETLDVILGRVDKSIPVAAQARVQLGTQMEPVMRQYHADLVRAPVREPSLCLGLTWWNVQHQGRYLHDQYPSLGRPDHPQWLIGGSPDGIVQAQPRRNLELKYTQALYRPLLEGRGPRSSTLTCTCCTQFAPLQVQDSYSHIWASHYWQMQTCMALTGNRTCDYGVGTPTQYYLEQISFEPEAWLPAYHLLIHMIEAHLKPEMDPDHWQEHLASITSLLQDLGPLPERILPVTPVTP